VPEVQEFGLEPGDQLLLCSDGLTGEVRPEEVEQILRDYPAEQAAELLIKGANASTTVIKDGQSVVLPGGNDNITLIIVNIPGDQPLPDPTLQIVPETTLETMKVETAPLETTKVDKTPVSTKSPWSRRMKRITSGLYILLLIIGAVLAFLFFAAPDQLAQGLSSMGINLFAATPIATQPPTVASAETTEAAESTEQESVIIVAVTGDPTETPEPVPSPEQTEAVPEAGRLPTVTRGPTSSPTVPPTATLLPPTAIPSPTVISPTLITQTGSFTQVDPAGLSIPELIQPVPFDEDPTQHNGGRGIRFVWFWPGEFYDNLSFQIRMYPPGGSYVGIHNAAELRKEPRFERLDNNTYALTVVLDGVGNITQSSSDYSWSVAVVQIEPEYRWLDLESEHRPISLLVPQNQE
jgi:Na+-transporting methylmalonyl-CoA/oxaloacetate decarboxylase gamma subunit